ncbi:MAG: hypothetical protein KBS72_07315 [Bacteroidales bacterium]|nr:hypothetical protein [Candidatus Cacconaster scatequi]
MLTKKVFVTGCYDLPAFAAAYKASFEAQTAMFPGMLRPTYIGNECESCGYITETIDIYSAMDGVLAWKMAGAGGGGYLALVVEDAPEWVKLHPEAIRITVRR